MACVFFFSWRLGLLERILSQADDDLDDLFDRLDHHIFSVPVENDENARQENNGEERCGKVPDGFILTNVAHIYTGIAYQKLAPLYEPRLAERRRESNQGHLIVSKVAFFAHHKTRAAIIFSPVENFRRHVSSILSKHHSVDLVE
jgi:hypothetical protein